MKKMGKKPQFIENKGGMEDGKWGEMGEWKREKWSFGHQMPFPPFLPFPFFPTSPTPP